MERSVVVLVGGWAYPSEKYARQLGWLFPIYEKKVPNHQPVLVDRCRFGLPIHIWYLAPTNVTSPKMPNWDPPSCGDRVPAPTLHPRSAPRRTACLDEICRGMSRGRDRKPWDFKERYGGFLEKKVKIIISSKLDLSIYETNFLEMAWMIWVECMVYSWDCHGWYQLYIIIRPKRGWCIPWHHPSQKRPWLSIETSMVTWGSTMIQETPVSMIPSGKWTKRYWTR